MTLIPRSDRKRVYALLSFIPAVLLYLVLLAYMYMGNFDTLADGVLPGGRLSRRGGEGA